MDRFLGGGIPTGIVTFLYGEVATGKTELSLRIAAETSRRGYAVIYVDSDGTLSPRRLEWLRDDMGGKGFEDMSFFFFVPEDFFEQRRLIEGLESYLRRESKLVVFDSITNLYRIALADGEIFILNRELGRQWAYLTALAKKMEIAILCTGQVYIIPDLGDVAPVARRVAIHGAQAILRLEFTDDKKIKCLHVERFPVKEAESASILLRFERRGIRCI